MSVSIAVETGAAPQGGQEIIRCSTPATQAAFIVLAEAANTNKSGFIQVVAEPDGGNGVTETKLLNLARIRTVV